MDDQNQPTTNPTSPEISGPPTPEPMTARGNNPEVTFGEPQTAEATTTETIPEPQAAESAFGTTRSTEPAPTDNTFSGPVDSSTNFNTGMPSEPAQAPSFAAAPEEKPKKKSNASSILMLLMFIVTLCGVGFGVYGMFFAPGKEVEKVVYQTVEKEVSAASEENSVYIGEWGLKIKLPETIDAAHVSYQYQGEKESGLGYSVVKFWGQPNTATAVVDYANPAKNTGAMVTVSLVPENYTCEAECPTPIKLDDGQQISVSGSQAVFSADETNANTEAETITTLVTALKNPENYSAF